MKYIHYILATLTFLLGLQIGVMLGSMTVVQMTPEPKLKGTSASLNSAFSHGFQSSYNPQETQDAWRIQPALGEEQ